MEKDQVLLIIMSHTWHHLPASKLGGNFADDASGRAAACWCQGVCVVAEVGRDRWAVVGGAAALVQLSSMKGAPTGRPSRKMSALGSADAVIRGRGGWRPGAWTENKIHTENAL